MEVKVRTIEADGQIAVEFADPVWLAGTGQLIGRTFDDGPENNLVPVIGEKIGQKLFKKGFIEGQRPRLQSALSAVELRDNRILFDSDWCIHGFLPNTRATVFCSKDSVLVVLGK
jgi:hypothetical protein